MKKEFEILSDIPGHPELKKSGTVKEGFAEINFAKHSKLLKEIINRSII